MASHISSSSRPSVSELTPQFKVEWSYISQLGSSLIHNSHGINGYGVKTSLCCLYLPLDDLCKRVTTYFSNLSLLNEATESSLINATLLYSKFNSFSKQIIETEETKKEKRIKGEDSILNRLLTIVSNAPKKEMSLEQATNEKLIIAMNKIAGYAVSLLLEKNYAYSLGVLLNCTIINLEHYSFVKDGLKTSIDEQEKKVEEHFKKLPYKLSQQVEVVLTDIDLQRTELLPRQEALLLATFCGEIDQEENFKTIIEDIRNIRGGTKNLTDLTALSSTYRMLELMESDHALDLSVRQIELLKDLSLQEIELLKDLRIRLQNGLYFTNQIVDIRTKIRQSKKDQESSLNDRKILLEAKFRKQMSNLKTGQGFVFYSGYHGHGILFEIEKRLDDQFFLRMINTGEGAQDNQISRVYFLDSTISDQQLEIILNVENKFQSSWAISNGLNLNTSSSSSSLGLLYNLSFNENFNFKTQKYDSCSILPLWAWLNAHLVYKASGESHPTIFQRLQLAFIEKGITQLGTFSTFAEEPAKN